jgi:hypothetical protein
VKAALLVASLCFARLASGTPPLRPADLDARIFAEWRKQHLQAGPLVDDAGFLRRVTIDLWGTIPTAEAVRSFLADRRKDKRAGVVDELLASPAYARHFAAYWDRVLMGRTPKNPAIDRAGFDHWLEEQLAHNRPWNALARDLIAKSGVNTDEPAVNWLLRYTQEPADLTGKLSRVFLGVQIQCAQCHNHPSEKWKQDDFRSLAACFAHTGPVPLEERQKGQVRKVELRDQTGPTFGGPKMSDLRLIALAPPRALDGTDFSASDNRRQALAAWVTRPQNPWFARAIVNRYWAHLVGRGFVEPIDDFRRSNPPVMPQVLDALAEDFSANGYDLKHLIRLICATRAYQLAVVDGRPGDRDEQLFVHHRMRMLTGEELYHALLTAAHLETALAAQPKLEQQIQNAFDFLFNIDEEGMPQTEFAGSIQQALMFLNGRMVHRAALAQPGSVLSGILDFPADDALKIEALYLRTLSRKPQPAETQRWVAYVNAPRAEPNLSKQQAYEDLFWALLNSSEMAFQH